MRDNSPETITTNDSDDRYRTLVELSPDAMIVTTEGKVVYANSAAREMWEASAQNDLIGKDAIELARPDFRDLSGQRQSEIRLGAIDHQPLISKPDLGERTNSAKLPKVEFVIQTLKGHEKHVESSGSVALFNGQPSAIFVVRDISERKKMEDSLQQSEADVRAFVRAMPDLLYRVNREGVMLDAKAPNEDELVGDTGERIGKTLYELMPADVANSWMECIGQALVTHEVQILHYELEIRGVSRVREAWVVANGADEVLVISRDVTENRKSQEALKRSEIRYRNLVETVPYGIEENDVNGIIQYANSAHHKQYGYDDGEMIGMPIWDLVATESEREELRAYLQYLAENRPPPSLYRGTRNTKSGKIIDVEIAWNYNIEEGQVTGFTSVITDVTERNIAQEALRISQARSLKLADQMAAVAEIGRVINSSLEIDEVYGRFCESLAKILPFDWVSVNWIDTVNGLVTMAYHAGAPEIRLNPGYQFDMLGSFSGEIVNSPGGVVVQGESAKEIGLRFPSLDALLEAGARSVLGVPLTHRESVIAVLIIGSSSDALYTPEDLEMAGFIGSQITGAISNAQIYAKSQEDKSRLSSELEASSAEIAVADEIAKIFTSSSEVDGIFDRFAMEINKLVDFDRASLLEVDTYSKSYRVTNVWGLQVPTLEAGYTNLLEDSYIQAAVRPGLSLLIEEFEPSGGFHVRQALLDVGLRSLICAPIIAQDQVVGFINLLSRRTAGFGLREQSILNRLANQIAPTIESGSLMRQLEASATEMAVVGEVARIITSTLETNDVYDRFAGEVKKLVAFDMATINLVDTIPDFIEIAYISGENVQNFFKGKKISLRDTQSSWVIANQETYLVGDMVENPEFEVHRSLIADGLRSLITLPLITNGKAIGTFTLASNRINAFGQKDRILLEGLASQIAPALENARLYREADRLALALASIGDAVIFSDLNGRAQFVNQPFIDMFGYSRDELIGKDSMMIVPAGVAARNSWIDIREVALSYPWAGSVRRSRKNGQEFDAYLTLTPVSGQNNTVLGFVEVLQDMTERLELEEQLRQSQKMESMGLLASGIAHDFNNVLTAIMGYSQFGITTLGPDHPVTDHFKTIRVATERAINLTNQLLVFSRQQPVIDEVFDLNRMLIDQGRMINSVLGSGIELIVLPAPDAVYIKADVNQMAQVLLNLAINAKDAMPRGGKLTIATSTVTLGEKRLESNPGAVRGQFVLLSVSDNGVGMPEETLSRIFEPFFTTKEIGKGTGLGLATCYGFVTQCGGLIEAESELGVGTEFKLFLPITDSLDLVAEPIIDNPPFRGGNETILLVEDEHLIRAFASQALRSEGYRVLEAANGEQAIELAKGLSGDEIHLLLSDVVMPRMGGLELAERFLDINPNVPVLFTSGYADQSEFGQVRNPAGVGFLPKPYDPKKLAAKVREILDN